MDPFSALSAFLAWLAGAVGKGAFGRIGSEAASRLVKALGLLSKTADDGQVAAKERAALELRAQESTPKYGERINYLTDAFIAVA